MRQAVWIFGFLAIVNPVRTAAASAGGPLAIGGSALLTAAAAALRATSCQQLRPAISVRAAVGPLWTMTPRPQQEPVAQRRKRRSGCRGN